ncbi:hypothetical protein ACFWBB_31020 [Streptomyces sp. NPDC060000]|uniref:hypothetical protein n=1 Tax=Streptomyces sp. NPDC060000 TaxID=3347031 RepID=UPI0036B83451
MLMFTLDRACHILAVPTDEYSRPPAPKPVRALDQFVDAHFLPNGFDAAAMRFVRARDVQTGDLIVGALPNPFLAVGEAVPHALPYPFTATPAALADRPCGCPRCSTFDERVSDYRGWHEIVHMGYFTVPYADGFRRCCAVWQGPSFVCVIPAQWRTDAGTGEAL